MKTNEFICGIYLILNKVNGKRYIGSTKNFEVRFRDHRYKMKMNTHPNHYLQNSYNKNGKDAFEYIVLELCDPKNLLIREQYWFETKPEYNLDPVDTNKTHSEETKKKISENKKRNWQDPIYRANYYAGRKKIDWEEFSKKSSLSHKGKIAINRRPVLRFTLDGIFIKRYDYIQQAKLDGFTDSAITKCCKKAGKQREQHKGCRWEYE